MAAQIQIKEVIDKCLFFLGAGASFDAGCKLSSGMLDDLKRRIATADDRTFNAPEKDALKFLLSCLEYHGSWRTLETSESFRFSPNIEELALLIRRIKNRENFLPYPITGNWADKLVALEAQYSALKNSDKRGDTLFDSLGKKIKSDLLEEWLKPNDCNFLNPLKEFLEYHKDEQFRMDFFSLNNDMVFENFFELNNSFPWRGFVSGEWRGFDHENFQNDLGRINLYKLHGSVDWVRLSSGDFKEKRHLNEKEVEDIDENHKPYVIFGQGTKTFSVEPFFSLINHLRKRLSQKSYIFVIGYSFFDPYINNLLIDAVKGTSKKLIIVNPFFGPDEIKIGIGNKRKLVTDDSGFFKIEYPKDITDRVLASYIEEIQKNSFYSELPEFNIKRMNAKSLEFIPIETKDFLSAYFSNGGKTLIDLVNQYEVQRKLDEEPF